ncbi:hypothetical protein VKT23_016386 [Stygiomarasmius scandens]|uniref:polynucleotide adenylyltransferase n=1 Tax=Marasmiellus scandens TaxID=2682957 RepID=A0ABR1IZ69_9AGAR
MNRLRHPSKHRFVAELSQCLFDFVIQLLPTPDEMSVKEDVRKLLEKLIRTIEPDSRLLSFGSTANGFSLRNSDMDLCCLIDSEERLSASDLVTMLGDLLERETKFHVKPLPHARIPIVKLSLDPSPGLPLGIACDIGFENRLALENTRLLMCYAMIDPTRVRTLVLFLKVWSKRRKINSPYKGTLSSYGYVLLVIYFLVHVKNPPVLPNLQQMPPLRPIPTEETHLAGYNTWFFDDIELLRQRWHSDNTESVAELLIDFFRYFSRDFPYNVGVASIRAGLLKKESKGWQNDLSAGRYNDARERNRICIEDPFETDYNVARCVTKDGLYTIRGEFMRASRILAVRPERAILALAELCEERGDEELVSPPDRKQVPPQTPYGVGSRPPKPNKPTPIPIVPAPRSQPPSQSTPRNTSTTTPSPPSTTNPPPPPAHMAPRRSKWTSPPPPEASVDDRIRYESQLGAGLELATRGSGAREQTESKESSNGSVDFEEEDLLDDLGEDIDARSDDVGSVRSFTEGVAPASTSTSYHPQGGGVFSAGPTFRRPSWLATTQSQGQNPGLGLMSLRSLATPRVEVDFGNEPPSMMSMANMNAGGRFGTGPRGRVERERFAMAQQQKEKGKEKEIKRSTSLSGSTNWKGSRQQTQSPLAVSIPLPPSPETGSGSNGYSYNHGHEQEPAMVFYQTRSPHTTFASQQGSPSGSVSPKSPKSSSPHSPLSPSSSSAIYHTHNTQHNHTQYTQHHGQHNQNLSHLHYLNQSHSSQQQQLQQYFSYSTLPLGLGDLKLRGGLGGLGLGGGAVSIPVSVPNDIFPASLPPLFTGGGLDTPTPSQVQAHHSHSNSTATIVPERERGSGQDRNKNGNSKGQRRRRRSRSPSSSPPSRPAEPVPVPKSPLSMSSSGSPTTMATTCVSTASTASTGSSSTTLSTSSSTSVSESSSPEPVSPHLGSEPEPGLGTRRRLDLDLGSRKPDFELEDADALDLDLTPRGLELDLDSKRLERVPLVEVGKGS